LSTSREGTLTKESETSYVVHVATAGLRVRKRQNARGFERGYRKPVRIAVHLGVGSKEMYYGEEDERERVRLRFIETNEAAR